jgi:uncharacterized protein YecT (DUF1311 family)
MSIKFPILILIFQLSILWCNCQAKEKEDKINTELSKCLDKTENQNTAGMCNCTYEALDKWDKRLNTIYKSLLSRLDSNAKGKLMEAQRIWVKFKEKEIDLIDATYGAADGTMWRIVRAEKVLEITRTRAADLEELADTLKEF